MRSRPQQLPPIVGHDAAQVCAKQRRQRFVHVLACLICVTGLSACSQGAGSNAAKFSGAAPPAAGSDVDSASGEMTTRLVGSIAIRERIALPDNAYAMVEVRNSAGPDAMPVVAEERIDLKGQQPPIPFALQIDRLRLPMDIGFAFRGAIFVDGKPRYVSDQTPVNLTTSKLDLGIVMLKSFQAEAFATEMACGDRLVRLSASRDAMQINLDGKIHRLTQVASETGTKLVSEDAAPIVFWEKGDGASLAVGNEAAQSCQVLTGGPNVADLLRSRFHGHGQSPDWELDLSNGTMNWNANSDAAGRRFATTPALIDGRRAVIEAVNGPLAIVEARPCQVEVSGALYPAAIRVEYAGQVFRGCGDTVGDTARK